LLQVTLEEEEIAAVTAAGSVIVILAAALQPAGSVMVTTYVPALKPVAVAPFPPEGDQV